MYLKVPIYFSNTVRPGDAFAGSVTTNGAGRFPPILTDRPQGWRHTISAKLHSARLASAEAIAEAPSSASGVLPLTDFGTASFSATTANGQPIGHFAPDQINMVSGTTVKASTSSLSAGTAFSVTWLARCPG